VESISLLLSTTTETVSASSAESRYGSSLKLAPRELGCPTKQSFIEVFYRWNEFKAGNFGEMITQVYLYACAVTEPVPLAEIEAHPKRIYDVGTGVQGQLEVHHQDIL
jgi:hypothetical protein